jgi:HD superfamily phosphohydrolase
MDTSLFKGFQRRIGPERQIIQEEKSFPNNNLIVKSSGASNLEQIVINKILLFPAIYHHHKVRAIECMVKGIFDVIWTDPDKKSRDNRLKFHKISDFLRLSEFDFFSLGMTDEEITPMVKRLLDRNLLKRCLVITPNYIVKDPELRLDDLLRLSDEYPKRARQEQVKKLRQFIWDELSSKYRTSINDLWVDIPKPPNIDKDVDRCWVNIGTEWLIPLREFFPYSEWLDTYESNKLKGHIFYIADTEHRKAVNQIAQKVFYELFLGVELDSRATLECKF